MTVTEEIQELLKKHLATKAVSAAGPAPAAAGKGSVLIAPEKTGEVFKTFARQQAAAMGLPEDDPKVRDAAAGLTRKKIGDLNYQNWQNDNRSKMEAADEAGEKADQEEADRVAQAKAEPIGDPFDNLRSVADGYTARAEAIGKDVARAEAQAEKLNMGTGAKAWAARVGVAVAGVEAAAVDAGDYVVTAPVSVVTDAVTGAKSTTPGEEAKGIAENLEISEAVATGKMQALYDQTRPAYKTFKAAQDRFFEARHSLLGCDRGRLADASKFTNTMESCLGQMVTAADTYKTTCDSLGISKHALGIDKWSSYTGEGSAGKGADLAVTLMTAGEGHAAEQIGKTVAEDEVKQVGKKALTKEAQELAAKEAEEKVKRSAKEELKEYGTNYLKDQKNPATVAQETVKSEAKLQHDVDEKKANKDDSL